MTPFSGPETPQGEAQKIQSFGDFLRVFDYFLSSKNSTRRKSKTPRKSPEKGTFLSLAFYNAPSLHTVAKSNKVTPLVHPLVFPMPLVCALKRFYFLALWVVVLDISHFLAEGALGYVGGLWNVPSSGGCILWYIFFSTYWQCKCSMYSIFRRTVLGSSCAPCYQRDLLIFCEFSATRSLTFL